MSVTLAQFVENRLDEIEEAALAVLGVNLIVDRRLGKPLPRWGRDGSSIRDGVTERRDDRILRVKHTWAREAEHIIRHDPARVLDEVDAKRRTLTRHASCGTGTGYCDDGGHGWDEIGGCADLADLAAPDHEHPDYNPAWKVWA
jgi:hypothetical protein